MPSHLRNLTSMLLHQIPTVLTLGLLGGIAWWGYVWDWKIPTLPELLHPDEAKKTDETEKKPQEVQKGPERADKPLPPFKIDMEEALAKEEFTPKRVEESLVGEYVAAHGDLDFDQDHYAHLSARAAGTAWSVHKHAGDEVKKGDILALIASPELARLKFDLQQTLLTVQTRERYYQRLESSGTGTAIKDIELAEFSLRDARLALSKDQQSLQNLGLNVPLEELKQLKDERQVAARLRTLGIPDTLMQSLDADMVTGNNLLPMIAPFDGMVIRRDLARGENVTPDKTLFVLADLHQLWIVLHVRLEDVGKLKLGQEVAFHLDGTNEDAPAATIKWISAEVDEKTRTVNVRADVPNPQGCLRPNTFGDARILVSQEKHLTVPNDALQFDGVSHLVFVQSASGTEFQPLRVKVGSRHEKFTVLLDGLKAGQTIATTLTHVLLSEMLKERIGGED